MSSKTAKVGLWIIQLGTPEAPTRPAVRSYLREFLGDPRVIDLPSFVRWPLVNLLIAPFRSKSSAHAYQSIWTERGSPLRFHTEDLLSALKSKLSEKFVLHYSMRIGKPSIAETFHHFRSAGCERIVVFPLYPQWASATLGSVIEEVFRVLGSELSFPSVEIAEPFYRKDFFLNAFKKNIRATEARSKIDHWIFSYHGLPESQIRKADHSKNHCLTDAERKCCAIESPQNRLCYRAQCHRTTEALRARLGWTEKNSSLSFQSRLGRAVWLGPSTEETLKSLAQKGVKKVGVICPSFVSDCLETIEEIGIRGRESFRAAGGEELLMVPCPNADLQFASDLSDYFLKHYANRN